MEENVKESACTGIGFMKLTLTLRRNLLIGVKYSRIQGSGKIE